MQTRIQRMRRTWRTWRIRRNRRIRQIFIYSAIKDFISSSKLFSELYLAEAWTTNKFYEGKIYFIIINLF